MLDKDLNMVQIQVYVSVCMCLFGSVKINTYNQTQIHTFSKAKQKSSVST
jgi:hypothetical protein